MTDAIRGYVTRLLAAVPPPPPKLLAELQPVILDWLGAPAGPGQAGGEERPRAALQQPRVHTADQAAAIIGGGCKASWLREKARLRKIPFTRLGSGYGWTDAQITETLTILEVRPEPELLSRPRARRPPAPPPVDVPLLKASVPRRMQRYLEQHPDGE